MTSPINELCRACREGNLSRVKSLLDEAQRNGNCELISGNDINWSRPLGVACYYARRDVVAELLRRGASIKAHSDLYDSPLYAAITGLGEDRDREEIVSMLLTAGADPNEQFRRDYSLLAGACSNGTLRMVELLISFGADPFRLIASPSGVGPCRNILLDSAIYSRKNDIVAYLIGLGLDVNGSNHFGCTPLITAVHVNNTEVIAPLLKAGADPNLESRYGNAVMEEVLWSPLRDISESAVALYLAGGVIRDDRVEDLMKLGPITREIHDALHPYVIRPALTILHAVHSASILSDDSALHGDDAGRRSDDPALHGDDSGRRSDASVLRDRNADQSPLTLLRCFPEILRFIITQSLPRWFVKDIEKNELP